MTLSYLLLAMIFVILPAAFGWLVLGMFALDSYRTRRDMRRADAFARAYNAYAVDRAIANHRTVYTRKRELRAIVGGKGASCEVVTLGPHGPRAA